MACDRAAQREALENRQAEARIFAMELRKKEMTAQVKNKVPHFCVDVHVLYACSCSCVSWCVCLSSYAWCKETSIPGSPERGRNIGENRQFCFDPNTRAKLCAHSLCKQGMIRFAIWVGVLLRSVVFFFEQRYAWPHAFRAAVLLC